MSKFSCFFFWGNPTNKTLTGTAYMWGLLIAKPPGQSEILSRSQVQFITFFQGKLRDFGVEENQFPELNRHILAFSQ
jgi:hypothetical protein